MFKKTTSFLLMLCMLLALFTAMPATASSVWVDSYDFNSYVGDNAELRTVPAGNPGGGTWSATGFSGSGDGITSVNTNDTLRKTAMHLIKKSNQYTDIKYKTSTTITDAVQIDFSLYMPDFNDVRLLKIGGSNNNEAYPFRINDKGEGNFFWDKDTNRYQFAVNTWYDVSIHYTFSNYYCEITINDGTTTKFFNGTVAYGNKISNCSYVRFGYHGSTNASETYFDDIAIYYDAKAKVPRDYFDFSGYTGDDTKLNVLHAKGALGAWSSTGTVESTDGVTSVATDRGTSVKVTKSGGKRTVALIYTLSNALTEAVQIDFSIYMKDFNALVLPRLKYSSTGAEAYPFQITRDGKPNLFWSGARDDFQFNINKWYDISIHYTMGTGYTKISIADGVKTYTASGFTKKSAILTNYNQIYFGYHDHTGTSNEASEIYFDDISISPAEPLTYGDFVFKSGDKEISNLVPGDITVSTDIVSPDGASESGIFCAALYNETDELCDFGVAAITITDVVTPKTLTVTVPDDGKAYKLRTYVWSAMQPVRRSETIHSSVVIFKLDDVRNTSYPKFTKLMNWAEDEDVNLAFGVVCKTLETENKDYYDALKELYKSENV